MSKGEGEGKREGASEGGRKGRREGGERERERVKSMDDNCGEWVECMGVASGCG